MKEFWDERFSSKEYIYGTSPNTFIQQQISDITPGRGLFPAEGEGRNAVFAAQLGWTCDCYDYSSVARQKALELAQSQGVDISYHISNLEQQGFKQETYDAVFITFLHLPPSTREQVHKKLFAALKPGGRLVMEVFDKQQLPLATGGPKNKEMLYTPDILANDFQGANVLINEVALRELKEGEYHSGKAHTIRFVAEKKKSLRKHP